MPIKDIQTTNKQHAVPQNIMDVEFKIIGDLTMRQFAYLMMFGGLAFVSFTYLSGIFRWPIGIIAVLLGVGFAFVPIEDRGMDQWVVNFFRAVYTPTQKIWKKDAVVPSVFMYENLALVKQELITLAPTTSRRKLEEYLETQERGEKKFDRLDFQDAEFIEKVKTAFANTPPVDTSYSSAPSYIGTTVIDEPIVSSPAVPIIPTQPMEPVTPPQGLPLITLPEQQVPAAPKDFIPAPAQSVTSSLVPVTMQSPKQEELKPVKPNKYNIKPVKKRQDEGGFRLSTKRDRELGGIMSPQGQAGRHFINLSSSSAGQIILPIRGEKKIKTTEEIDIEGEIKEKTDQLNKLIEQIKKEEKIVTNVRKDIPPSAAATPNQKTDFDIEANTLIETVKTQNTNLTKEIEALKTQLEQNRVSNVQVDSGKEAQLQKLQQEKARSDAEYATLLNQLRDLQEKLKQREQISPTPTSTVSAAAVVANMQPLSNKPNTISGVVKGNTGNTLEGIVLLVKNNKGEPVRAIKTNSLGQFTLVTPLANGAYTVEVGPYNKVGLTFDIISIEAKGEPIPPIEFVGR